MATHSVNAGFGKEFYKKGNAGHAVNRQTSKIELFCAHPLPKSQLRQKKTFLFQEALKFRRIFRHCPGEGFWLFQIAIPWAYEVDMLGSGESPATLHVSKLRPLSEKIEGQQLKGKIVSEHFQTFSRTFQHCLDIFKVF